MSPAPDKRSLERHARQIARARGLRQAATEAEAVAWKILRSFRKDGFIFRRQHPIGRYFADFCCTEERLIVELDGGVHAQPGQVAHDAERDNWLRGEGYTLVRLSNGVALKAVHEFFREVFGVVARLRAARLAGALGAVHSPHSPPSPQPLSLQGARGFEKIGKLASKAP